jgi:hypothetical protein
LEPCCFRFSRLVVENTLHHRSKSSTFDVAKNTVPAHRVLGAAARRRWCGESTPIPFDGLETARPAVKEATTGIEPVYEALQASA